MGRFSKRTTVCPLSGTTEQMLSHDRARVDNLLACRHHRPKICPTFFSALQRHSNRASFSWGDRFRFRSITLNFFGEIFHILILSQACFEVGASVADLKYLEELGRHSICPIPGILGLSHSDSRSPYGRCKMIGFTFFC